MQAIHTHSGLTPLFDNAGTRAIETQALAQTASGDLMGRAGRAVAHFARALNPHAQQIWVVCGPGNNGGDGLIAAAELSLWGRTVGCHVTVSWAGPPSQTRDAQAALTLAKQAGVVFSEQPPRQMDTAIDAMLGIGCVDAPRVPMVERLRQMQEAPLVVCVDTPTGLNGDTGSWLLPGLLPTPAQGQRRATLSLLTLKPGLFTGQGRDWAGEVWLDNLGAPTLALHPPSAKAQLFNGSNNPAVVAPHASHKGSFGQVTVIGGRSPSERNVGMQGAAMLAARAALHGGAGRVYWAPLGASPSHPDGQQPDLMVRALSDCWLGQDDAQHVWVAGCGGGQAMAAALPHVLAHPGPVVLDADALNAIAAESDLASALRDRAQRGAQTVLTPHPLEAARLLQSTVTDVQAHRLDCAQRLAVEWGATVVLKGSGSVVTGPGLTPWLNQSGNARLGIAGTGDVLAGLIGAALARGGTQLNSVEAQRECVARAVWAHGQCAQDWPSGLTLTASRLAQALQPV